MRPPLVWLAVGGVAGIVGQAALGGLTVLLDLHPATVAAHFLLSMVMIALAFVLYWRSGEAGDGPPIVVVRPELRWVAFTIVVLAAIALVLGTLVTGSGPHSGDADEIARFDLDVRMISWLHADVVLVFLGFSVAFLLGARLTNAPEPRATRGAALDRRQHRARGHRLRAVLHRRACCPRVTAHARGMSGVAGCARRLAEHSRAGVSTVRR